MAKFATFCQTIMQRTKRRDFVPSRNEVIACLGRRDLNTVVYCYGGGQCSISINSGTTAGEVVQKLSLGLRISGENNRFALFEICGSVSKVIDDRTILADILGKFEMSYMDAVRVPPAGGQIQKWKLFFKLFCFLKPQNIPIDSIESAFMFEQFCDDVVIGRFPASPDRLLKLAALRMQFLEGDYEMGATIEDVGELYPVSRVAEEVKDQKDIYTSASFQETYYQKTLRGSKVGVNLSTLGKKFKAPEITEEDRLRAAVEVRKNTVKQSIIDLWRKLQGITSSQAQQKYMDLLSNCPAFGSTFFEAEYTNKDQRFPRQVWLAISAKGVQIYQRGAVAPIQTYSYENIISFGAPVSNEYRLVVEGQVPISLQTSQVAEIAKLMKVYISLVVAH